MVQGRADIPLNDLGRAQAAALAGALADDGIRAIYSSPLSRARETAGAIAAAVGLDVELEPDLVEMNVGEMEGLSGPEMRARFPEFLATWVGPDGPEAVMPGGESLRQVQDRGWAVVERLRSMHADDTVVAVSHNFVIVSLVCRAAGIPLGSFRRFRQSVAARTVIDLREDRGIVRSLNDTCHLDGPGLRSAGPWEGPLMRQARGERPG
jgi:probable phosphoglycerate mutase